MAKKPNYGQERRDRDRIKAARKAEKLNARTSRSDKKQSDTDEPENVQDQN